MLAVVLQQRLGLPVNRFSPFQQRPRDREQFDVWDVVCHA
jgi:hypothetical protein